MSGFFTEFGREIMSKIEADINFAYYQAESKTEVVKEVRFSSMAQSRGHCPLIQLSVLQQTS